MQFPSKTEEEGESTEEGETEEEGETLLQFRGVTIVSFVRERT